jgi:hypothetical protein
MLAEISSNLAQIAAILGPLPLIILALASLRITIFIVEDFLFEPVRNVIWKRFPPETSKFGYMFTCVQCTSVWVSLLLVGAYILIPVVTLVIALVFALSGVVILINDFRNR